MVDGEERPLRYTLDALERLAEHLGLDGLSDIPRKLADGDPATIKVFLSVGLADVADVGNAHVPIIVAQDGILRAINLAYWGDEEGPADDVDPPMGSSEAPGTASGHES